MSELHVSLESHDAGKFMDDLSDGRTMMATETNVPLVLFSGLAADSRIFILQKLAFPQLRVPVWPRPSRDETLDVYARRLAVEVGTARCVIGGASFGGIVALHVAQYMNPTAVILIGSIKSPSELPPYARFARPLRFLVPVIPIRVGQLLAWPLTLRCFHRLAPFTYGLACQLRDSDPCVFRWSLSRILDWSAAPVLHCPIFHIHGDRDWTLPIRYTEPDTVVAGGGHVLTVTHGSEVNAFIRGILAQTDDNAEDLTSRVRTNGAE
jgi:pimeloyl-ACP methyl ester carboxylesterase